MYSFIVLIITGTFLALFFQPSMREVVYHGSLVHQARQRADEPGLCLHAEHQLRGARRPAVIGEITRLAGSAADPAAYAQRAVDKLGA
jgi:hypothetical protein